MIIHVCIHGRCYYNTTFSLLTLEVPAPEDTSQQIVAQTIGEFGHRVGGEGCHNHDLGELAQLNVQHRVLALLPAVPLIAVREVQGQGLVGVFSLPILSKVSLYLLRLDLLIEVDRQEW